MNPVSFLSWIVLSSSPEVKALLRELSRWMKARNLRLAASALGLIKILLWAELRLFRGSFRSLWGVFGISGHWGGLGGG